MNKRKQQAENTRRQIINKSCELIEKRGFDNITVDDICTAADISKGAFYHHFKSKSDIIGLFEGEFHSTISAKLQTAEKVNVSEQLRLFVFLWTETAETLGLKLTKELIKYIASDEYIESSKEASPIFYRKMLYDMLQKSIDEGQLKKETSVEMLTRLYMTTLYGTTLNWCIFNGGILIDGACK